MNFRAIILYPLTLIYTLITMFRNHLFNINYTRSFNYDIMTINVGNLSVGGTGKTPMVEYLIRLLKKQYSVATLSRGYKRKSKGFLIANNLSSVEDIGDEPYQFYTKFKNGITVAVGENRALAIPRILMEHPETQVILLDDAYQHRNVTPDFNLLLTQYISPFYKDFVLPSGYLRETRKGASRADAIIITKCPADLSITSKEEVLQGVKRYVSTDTPIYFSYIKYGIPEAFSEGYKFGGKVILFAGLANIKPLKEYVSNSFNLVETVSYSDHYNYKPNDLIELVNKAKRHKAQLITTEKDIAKIRSNQLFSTSGKVDLFYLPISVQFLFQEEEEFNSLVQEAIVDKYEQEEAN